MKDPRKPINVKDIKPGEKTGPDIARDYVELMVELSHDPVKNEKFQSKVDKQKYAKELLKNQVGIYIPTDTPLYLDKHNTTRPSIWLIKDDRAFTINEKIMGFNSLAAKQGDEKLHTLEVKVKQGKSYEVDMDFMIATLLSNLPSEALNLIGNTIKEASDGYVTDWNYETVPVSSVICQRELEELREVYQIAKDAQVVLVRMPFLEINSDLKLTYKMGESEEIILTCA